MKLKNTIIVFIIAVIAFGFLLFDKTRKTSEELRASEKNIFHFESDDVTKLTIEKKDGGKIVCVKEKDEWKINKPLKARADKWSVNSIVNEIKDLKWERRLSRKEGKKIKLGDYQLDEPRVVARVKLKEKKGKTVEHEILVGAEVGNSVFIKLKGNPDVYRVKKWLYDKLNKEVNELRDKTVVKVEKDKVTKVALKYGETSVETEKKDDKWRIKQPIADRGDTGEIEKVIDKVKNLRVPGKDDFVDDNPGDLAKYGLDKPTLTVTLWEGETSKSVKFGKKVKDDDKKVYCMTSAEDFVYAVNKSNLDDIKKDPGDLRDKKIARFKTDDAEKIALTHGKETIVIAKKDDKWKITEPSEMKTDEDDVKDLLKKITEAEIKSFESEKPKPEEIEKFGLKAPAVEVTINIKDQETPEKFVIGTKKGKEKKYYAKRAEADVVFSLEDEDLYKYTTKGYLPFLDKQVLDFDKDDVKKLTVKREDKTFVCLKTDDDKWEVTEPIKFAGDKARIGNILSDMDDLEAKEFVAEEPANLAEYGLDKPTISATVEYEAEEEKADEEEADKDKAKEEEADKEKKDEKEGKAEKAEKEKEKSEGKDEKKEDNKNKEKKPKKKLATKTLLIGKKTDNGDSYAKVADGKLIFTLQSWRVNDFKKELVERQITKFDKDDVKKITLSYATKEVVYEKKGDKWRMTKPEDKEAKKSDVDDILNTLDDFKGDDIAAYSAPKDGLKKYGLDKPELTLTIGLEEGDKVVAIGSKTSDNKYHIKTPDSEFIFLAQQWDVNKLMKEKPAPPKKKKAESKATKKPAAKEKKPTTKGKGGAAKGKAAPPKERKTKQAPAKENKGGKAAGAKGEGTAKKQAKPKAEKAVTNQKKTKKAPQAEKPAPKPQGVKKEVAPKTPQAKGKGK